MIQASVNDQKGMQNRRGDGNVDGPSADDFPVKVRKWNHISEGRGGGAECPVSGTSEML